MLSTRVKARENVSVAEFLGSQIFDVRTTIHFYYPFVNVPDFKRWEPLMLDSEVLLRRSLQRYRARFSRRSPVWTWWRLGGAPAVLLAVFVLLGMVTPHHPPDLGGLQASTLITAVVYAAGIGRAPAGFAAGVGAAIILAVGYLLQVADPGATDALLWLLVHELYVAGAILIFAFRWRYMRPPLRSSFDR